MSSQTTRVSDFMDSLGVVTHVNSAPYDSPARIDAMLDHIGIANIRQSSPINAQSSLDLAELGRLGARIDLLINGNGPVRLEYATNAITEFLPWLNAVELPNEVDIFPVSYAGLTDTRFETVGAAVRFQQDVYAAIRANPAWNHLEVFGLSIGGIPLGLLGGLTDLSAHADFANVHAYAPHGIRPGWVLPAAVQGWRQIAPSNPVVVTETGYYTVPGHTGWGGVSESVQARYLLDTALGNASRGVHRTYFYDLIDDGGDRTEREQNFGLFRYDGSAKPAATALHNLATILADHGAGAEGFGTSGLDYSLSGMPFTASSMLLQKSDGAHIVAVWNEEDLWDEVRGVEIASPIHRVTLEFGRSQDLVTLFDPMLGSVSVRTLHDVSSITFDLASHPLIIQVGGEPANLPGGVPGGVAVPLLPEVPPGVSPGGWIPGTGGGSIDALRSVGRASGSFVLDPSGEAIRAFAYSDDAGIMRHVDLGTAARVDFADGWVEFTGQGEGAMVSRLYRGILSRDADAAGLAVQVSALDHGGAIGVARAMLASPEGQDVASSPVASYVAQLYRQQLGRAPEAGAAEYWEAQLMAGASRADMAVSIATSVEASLDRLGLTRDGLVVSRFEALEVGQAYGGVLGRLADAAGLEFWTAHRSEGYSKSDIAHALAGSPEFTSSFGGLTNIDFIQTVYRNALGREAEAGAFDYYEKLLGGGMSRADLAAAFQESAESASAVLRLAGSGLDLL